MGVTGLESSNITRQFLFSIKMPKWYDLWLEILNMSTYNNFQSFRFKLKCTSPKRTRNERKEVCSKIINHVQNNFTILLPTKINQRSKYSIQRDLPINNSTNRNRRVKLVFVFTIILMWTTKVCLRPSSS